MNREMRRLAEREERRKKQKDDRGRRSPIGGSKGPPGPPQSRWSRLVQFLREVRVELSRVGWPSREQMIAFTAVTVITAGALTAYVFVIDLGFNRTVLALIRALAG